jgi:hypothetical protein
MQFRRVAGHTAQRDARRDTRFSQHPPRLALRVCLASDAERANHFGDIMPRISERPSMYLALSPAGVANALGIRPDEVKKAIDANLLPVHVMGIKRRILGADIEAWVRSWPKPTKRVYRKRISPNA